MDIQNLLDRIEESVVTARTPDAVPAGLARDWTVRQTPSDLVPSSKRTGITHPFLSQSIASISGVSHDTAIQFMQMLEQGLSWVTAAEKLNLSTGQAMDIKSAMVDVGAYREPGQLAEELRFLADSIYRLASEVSEDEDRIYEATKVLREFSLLSEQIVSLRTYKMPDILDTVLPADALVLANAYAAAIADQLILPPNDPQVFWQEVTGDDQEARVEGMVGDQIIKVHVSMQNSEAPFMHFSVPEMDSEVFMELTSHNWMAPLTLTMQHVSKALLQRDYHYSELEQYKRINLTPVEESRRTMSEYKAEKLKAGPVDYATDEQLLQAANDMSGGAYDALSDAYDGLSIYVKARNKSVYNELVSLGFARDPKDSQFAPHILMLTREGRAVSIMIMG